MCVGTGVIYGPRRDNPVKKISQFTPFRIKTSLGTPPLGIIRTPGKYARHGKLWTKGNIRLCMGDL